MTKAKSNVMTDFGAPIIVLVLICAIMSGLLAFTNSITKPIIDKAEEEANRAARLEVLPAAAAGQEDAADADPFEEVTVDGLPDSITGVFKATNGAGYTFSITTQGYGGKNTLKMTVGIDMDGKITETKVLSHSETAGLGSKITGDAFRSQFPGKDANLDGVDNISGATFSSNYYRAAIADAYTAYGMVKG
ncbi:MAG: FMN-binding protein [Clostridiales bacterium]|nr:FMN-binding protein [Clostridiales bacterium]